MFSLRVQRSFWKRYNLCGKGSVLSACAEVFLYMKPLLSFLFCSLCVCRGLSSSRIDTTRSFKFSLRVQRSFLDAIVEYVKELVLSACAEVFLVCCFITSSANCSLCVCRGLSHAYSSNHWKRKFSLRVQRSFYSH